MVWLAERGSKTRQGLEGSHQRHFNPKIFATGTEQCPVRYFKIFESHRPEEAKTPTSPFFLAINHNAWRTKSTWYKVSPLGKNQIGQFLPKAAKKAGLQACGRKLSNHSVRIAAARCSVQIPTRVVSAFKRCRTIHSSRRQSSDQFQTAYLLFTREIQPAALKKM